MIELDPDVVDLTDDEVCKADKRETRKIMDFWKFYAADTALKERRVLGQFGSEPDAAGLSGDPVLN